MVPSKRKAIPACLPYSVMRVMYFCIFSSLPSYLDFLYLR